MKRHERFQGNYLKKEQLDGKDLVVQIDKVEFETLKARDGKTEQKTVLHFTDGVRPMVLNQENWDTIASMYGDDDGDWFGHRITLYHDPNVRFGNQRVGGIRVRKASAPVPFPEPVPAPAPVPAPVPAAISADDIPF